MANKELDKILKKGGFTKQHGKNMQVQEAEKVSENQSPGDLSNSRTPHPKDSAKPKMQEEKAAFKPGNSVHIGRTMKETEFHKVNPMKAAELKAKAAKPKQQDQER